MPINIREILLSYYESNKISIMISIVSFMLYFVIVGVYYFKHKKLDD